MVIIHYLIILSQKHQDFLIMLLLLLLIFHLDYLFYFYIHNNYNFMNIPIYNIIYIIPNYQQNIHNIILNIYFFYNYKQMVILFKMRLINSLLIIILQIMYFSIIIHQIINNIMVVYTNMTQEVDINVKTFIKDMVVVDI